MLKGEESMTQKEHEITRVTNLCNPNGKLNQASVGWARSPLIHANLRGSYLRKKKWNYWCVFGQDALFSATISHLDYAAVCFVYYVHYETKRYIEKTIIVPFGKGCKMPEQVQENVHVIHKELSLFFISTNRETTLKVSCPNFNGEWLEADITLTYPDHLDTLNVVVPWSNNKFQFTAKHHCLPAKGYFKVGNDTFTFDGQTDFGVLDYGRGIWPRNCTWNWAMASGKQQGDTMGLNFGGKWTDGTGSTENAIMINGEITKISEDVMFTFEDTNYMNPWQITSPSGKIDLNFYPFFERVAKTNAFLIKSEVHQMVGHYTGSIVLSPKKVITIDNLIGCIEDHHALW